MTGSATPRGEPLYEVRGLSIDLYTARQSIRAVDDCSFAVHAGETLAIVGESGSGKTVMTLAPLGLLPEGVAVDVQGSARTPDGDVLGRRRAGLLGKEIGVVFQDPSSALNPLRRIGPQLAAQAQRFGGVAAAAARADAVAQLRRVGIADPEARYGAFPHELSGGMRQRAMIALALAGGPKLLLADEPTTALDATVQAQIVDLLKRIRAETGLGILLITHDIGVVASLADRVAVMYAGRIVEEGDALGASKTGTMGAPPTAHRVVSYSLIRTRTAAIGTPSARAVSRESEAMRSSMTLCSVPASMLTCNQGMVVLRVRRGWRDQTMMLTLPPACPSSSRSRSARRLVITKLSPLRRRP